MKRLQVILQLLNDFEHNIPSTLLYRSKRGADTNNNGALSPSCYQVTKQLSDAAVEMKDFLTSLKPTTRTTSNGSDESDSNNDDDAQVGSSNGKESMMEAVQSGLGSILPTLDPPPHNSIFGFDVQRGCTLSRYSGARQMWVPRLAGGGMIDCLYFPSKQQSNNDVSSPRNTHAVLYCNPNAGLIEVIAGMSLTGGNIPAAGTDAKNNNSSSGQDDNWVDYYTELGIDVYVFNYAGYGRSYGTTMFSRSAKRGGDPSNKLFARFGRILHSALFAFQPTPETLRADGIAVAQYMTSAMGVTQLIIHGESIGGMAAAGTARYISSTNPPILSTAQQQHQPSSNTNVSLLLICDRTFCNLEALAQRLVGGWSGYAIRLLTPLWNMDVANDFLMAQCPKIVASDAADVIIQESASLKSGIATYTELYRHRHSSTTTSTTIPHVPAAITNGLGWVTEIPLHYRMAEYENVCVTESRFRHSPGIRLPQSAPAWPRDKYITVEEAIHFAACCKRIAKYAKLASASSRRRNHRTDVLSSGDDTDGVDEEYGGNLTNRNISNKPIVFQAWILLGCCDGLTGMTLGVATKHSGYDLVVSWLCSCLTFGSQVLAARAEGRLSRTQPRDQQRHPYDCSAIPIDLHLDFDQRPDDYQHQEQTSSVYYPKPIPEVLQQVRVLLQEPDEMMSKCKPFDSTWFRRYVFLPTTCAMFR